MAGFQLPENLTDHLSELDQEGLEALHGEALAELNELYESGDRSPATVAAMEQLAAGLNEINTHITAISERETALAEMVNAANAQASGDDEAPPDTEEVPDEAPVDETPPDTTEEVTDEPADVPPPDVEVVLEDEDEDDETNSTQEPMPVAASSTPPQPATPSATALNAHRGGTTTAPVPTRPREPASIVAAANLPGFNQGDTLTMDDVAVALESRIATFPKHGRSGNFRSGVAQIRKAIPEDLRVPDNADVEPYARRAADESQLPGGSLTAAGTGWCAPSETWYDLLVYESTDGILSLPSVQVSRGGIQHTLGPDFRSIYQSGGYFNFTEADDIAGDYDGSGGDKPCMVVPCPEFENDRLGVSGLCITSPILQNAAYPELLRRFLDGALVAHAHQINGLIIEDLVAGSTAVSPTEVGGYTTSLLSSLELQVQDVRYAHRMSQSTTLEAVFPYWALGIARADLSNRLGVELLDVTDAQIISWMRARGVNPQFVYDWQDDLVDGASGFGSLVPATDWPATVDYLLYPAGTWVKGENDVITVDAIYDSVNLPTNMFTALFTEEGWMTMKRGHESRVVTVAGWNCFGDTAAGTACV